MNRRDRCILGACVLALGVAVRLPGASFPLTTDLSAFVRYVRALQADVGVLGTPFTKLSSSHLYGLLLAAQLPWAPENAVRALHACVDYALAGVVFALTRRLAPARALLASALCLLTPTVVLNASYWGQIDVVYTLFLLIGVGCLVRLQQDLAPRWFFFASLAYGIALSFKLQASLHLPLLLFFAARAPRLRAPALALVPLPYALSVLPRLPFGFRAADVFFDYSRQIQAAHVSAPTLTTLLGLRAFGEVHKTWIGFGVGALLALAAVVLGWRSRARALGAERVLLFALFTALLVPFCMPSLHERYFYPADVLAVSTAVVRNDPVFALVPLCVVGSSLVSYFPYLFHAPAALWLLSLTMAACLLVLAGQLRTSER